MTARLSLVILFLALVLSWPLPATAQTGATPAYERAMEAVRAGRFAEGLPDIRRAAANGYPQAVYNLALMQRHGWGVTQNPSDALSGFQRAFDLGYRPGRIQVAEMYRNGEGGPVRLAETIALYRAAAADGDASGEFGLGVMYDSGEGLPQNAAMALYHFKRASDLGSGVGSFNAGQMLLTGEPGVERDPAAALPYLMASADQDMPVAYNALAYVYRSGVAGTVDYQRARDWLYRGEAAGHADSSALLDHFNDHAQDEMNDLQALGKHALAASAAQQLCDVGDDHGCYAHGNYLLHGAEGVTANPQAALPILSGTCQTRPEFGCGDFHYAVMRHGQFATRQDILDTRDYFEQQCRPEYDTHEQCHALALLYYYPGYGLQNPVRAKALSVQTCFNSGYQPACPMAYEIMNYENRQSRPTARQRSSTESFFGGLGNFLGDLGDGLAAASASASGYNYGARTYSSEGQTSYQPLRYESSWQAQRDFDNALRATRNIGTGFNSTCRPGNPYC